MHEEEQHTSRMIDVNLTKTSNEESMSLAAPSEREF